jgi:malate dehydrogenase (oxaloacetate-decarboxylating)(NADP+)
MITKEEALRYHSRGRKGKIEVNPTKPCVTQLDLSLAYTPGVAEPCRVIEKDPAMVFEYTARGNLVAVVTNGTAVLGLGNIGPLAGKPVMEGKGVLFKRFADVDVFDIELDTMDPDEIINIVKKMEPTFGGVNLEDIKAPECFYIERKLKEICDIPVFHDDQHGTAIISGAALINACEITGKDIAKIKIVFNGAGAAGIACAKHYMALGAKLENIIMCDSKGVIYRGREQGMNEYKAEFAIETKDRTLADAMRGADVFLGVSAADVVTEDMVRSMQDSPVLFAMANPDPEITYPRAKAARANVIMATGRSDYPNQVNNVLGFPFIFRGALDVRARSINDEMKVAATMALAGLAKEPVPESVIAAYGGVPLSFGRDYIIPKPFDYRVLLWEARAVAEAAMKSGVARLQIDPEEYTAQLEARLGRARSVMRGIISSARNHPKRIVFPEGENQKILRAASSILREKIGKPVLLGDTQIIRERARELDVDLEGIELVDPRKSDKTEKYAEELHKLRRYRGMTMLDARRSLEYSQYYGLMMVRQGDADAFVSGATWHYPDVLRPALQIFPRKDNGDRIAGMNLVLLKDRVLFFADTTVNINPSAEELAHITVACARQVSKFGITPRVAMLSYSNFGSVQGPLNEKIRQAIALVRRLQPNLEIDGEMQADTAVTADILKNTYPFSKLKGEANILIFPDLQSGNIAYKLIQRLGGAEIIGPLLIGMAKPIQVLQVGSYTVRDIVHLAAYAAMEAQGEFKEEMFTKSISDQEL